MQSAFEGSPLGSGEEWGGGCHYCLKTSAASNFLKPTEKALCPEIGWRVTCVLCLKYRSQ